MIPSIIGASNIGAISITPDKELQVAGARLSAYTAHVPIRIGSTQDFITQGWPGSGTEQDPYLIYGLNITYDVGLVSINITNTDAYFKIVDCVINQQSNSVDAILFENVLHGSIEYCTISAVNVGISLYNVSNTLIDNVDMTMDNGDMIDIIASNEVSVTHSVLTITSGRVIYASTSNYLAINDVTVEGSMSSPAIDQSDCNHSSILNFNVDTAYSVGTFNNVRDLTVLGTQGTNLDYGLLLESVNDVQIANSNLSSSSESIKISNNGASNITVDLCRLSSTDSFAISSSIGMNHSKIINNNFHSSLNGIYLLNSHDLIINNNVFDELGKGKAIYSKSSTDFVISNNAMSNFGMGSGILLSHIVNFTISNNLFDGIPDRAVTANYVNKTIFAHNEVTDTTRGIDCDNSYYWDIVFNSFDIDDFAMKVTDSSYFNSSYNSIIGASFPAIDFDTIDNDLVIVGNDISDVNSYSIALSNAPESVIENNTMTRVNTGINIYICPNVTVRYNQINEAIVDGILVHASVDAHIYNNTISSGPTYGIHVSYSKDSEFVGNTMMDCGFYFDFGQVLTQYVFTMNDNHVNGLPVYYGLNKHGVTIDGNSHELYGQIFLINSTDISLQNTSFSISTVAVGAYYTSFVTIDGLDVKSSYNGMLFYECSNLSISNSRFIGESGLAGIDFVYTDNVTLSTIYLSAPSSFFTYAFTMKYGQCYTFRDITILNSFNGIYSVGTDNVTITGSQLKDNFAHGIYACDTSLYWEIKDSVFINNQYGVLFNTGTSHWIIDNSTFLYNSGAGLYSIYSSSDYNTITNSYFEGNDYAIYSSQGDNWTIIGNTIRWNQKGVRIYQMTGPIIYENTFVGNMEYNGYDDGTNNWDNGVDTGNAWDDYSGTGAYDISGGLSKDYYPSRYLPTTPIISSPLDIEYAEGTDHYLLTWYAYDDYLINWEVSLDGTAWASDAWNFDNITVDVGGLSYGDHSVTVTLYDNDGNNVTDIVEIHVYDGTTPLIDGLYTAIAFVGASNQLLVWNVSDAHPTNYSIYVDDTLMIEGNWGTGTISYDVSGLSAGDHDVRLVVRDVDLNEASDSVLVRMIVDSVSPTINAPEDITIYYGSSGKVIAWTPYDLYPDRYEVTLNGTIVRSGDWSGENILVSLIDLDVGTYQFTLAVYDGSGNSATDSVTVTVLPSPWNSVSTTTLLPSTPPDSMMLLLVGAGTVAVVIVVAALYLRKRRNV